jgi:serine protease Do
MNTDLSKKSLAVFTSIAIVSGFVGGAVTERFLDDNSFVSNGDVIQPVKMELVEEKSEVIDAIQKVSPSVVSIVISQELKNIRNQGMSPFELFFKDDPFFEDFFGQPYTPEPAPEENDEPIRQKVGGGSGFIVSKEGLILTNRHVVASDDAEYTVLLHDGTEFKAEVVSRDPFNDIAVIKLVPEEGAELPELPPVNFGNSTDLKIGQSVIAIGNALAEFANSATRGIVSAKGRQILASDGAGRGENLSGLIQTDAAINPGNSGGPLINLAGEVVGINTAIASGANGIGFAIPIDDVKSVVKSVEEHGKIVRPILGVMFTMLTPELAKELGLEIEEGALLKGDGQSFAVLPGKPAEKAGLLEKDVILEVNGVKVTRENPLQREVMKYAPGDKVKVKYLRNGEERETEITLGEAETDVKKE